MFNDFLAKQPLDVISKTDITDTKITLPIKVDADEFYSEFKEVIDTETLTVEKAIYVAASYEKKEFKKSTELLNERLKY